MRLVQIEESICEYLETIRMVESSEHTDIREYAELLRSRLHGLMRDWLADRAGDDAATIDMSLGELDMIQLQALARDET